MKLIIAGGRDYRLTRTDLGDLDWLHGKIKVTEVVSGCARGADKGGEMWAESRGLPIKRFPADWDTFGKRAGYLRNAQMADYADAVVLFPGNKGTSMMFDLARERGLKIYDWRQ